MSYYADLETDNGLQLPLEHPPGWPCGGPLMGLITNLEYFCGHVSELDSAEQEWILALIHGSDGDFCSIIQPLTSSWYIHMDENSGSEEGVVERWQEASACLAGADEIIQALMRGNPKPIPQIDTESSLLELKLLRALIVTAIDKRAMRLRIALY